jgi:hypothetical protein
MTPALVDGRLPAGEWTATWSEVEDAFGTSAWRLHLIDGCRRCSTRVARPVPWPARTEGRVRLRVLLNIVEAGSGEFFVEFFQRDPDGQREEIVGIDLEEFAP